MAFPQIDLVACATGNSDALKKTRDIYQRIGHDTFVSVYGWNESAISRMIIEPVRQADFRAIPVLADFISTMLQDMQYREMDEACEEEREERDTGTIYTLPDATYDRCKMYCIRFMCDNATHIEAALELVPMDRIGSTLWLLAAGHGVSFGNAPCLSAMDEWARANTLEHSELYFGNDGKVYLA